MAFGQGIAPPAMNRDINMASGNCIIRRKTSGCHIFRTRIYHDLSARSLELVGVTLRRSLR